MKKNLRLTTQNEKAKLATRLDILSTMVSHITVDNIHIRYTTDKIKTTLLISLILFLRINRVH